MLTKTIWKPDIKFDLFEILEEWINKVCNEDPLLFVKRPELSLLTFNAFEQHSVLEAENIRIDFVTNYNAVSRKVSSLTISNLDGTSSQEDYHFNRTRVHIGDKTLYNRIFEVSQFKHILTRYDVDISKALRTLEKLKIIQVKEYKK